MNRLLLKQILMNPLKNERGVAALMGVVMGIVIVGSIAFNFLAESRQKQTGSVLTYTSTNAFMIAEAGMRYAQKCLIATDATCTTPFPNSQNNADWTVTVPGSIASTGFGDGSFAVTFPTNAGNDPDNIFAIATGTYKGAQRTIRRFISRACVLGQNAASSCLGTITNNNSTITPPPTGAASTVCPAGGPVGASVPPPLANPTVPPACNANCNGGNGSCPNFNAGNHLTGGFLNRATFCNMNINGVTVAQTSDADLTDDTITVLGNLVVRDQASLRLNNDNATSAINTTINVYGNTTLRNGGNIRVNGTLTLQSGATNANTVALRDSSQVNVISGNVGDALIMAQGNISINNTSRFVGGLMSNSAIIIRNNGNVTGSIQANNVRLRNNAQLTFTPIPPGTLPGGNTPGISQCTSGATGPGWSE
jgi:hypothetical protein